MTIAPFTFIPNAPLNFFYNDGDVTEYTPTITRRQGRYAGNVAIADCKQFVYGILFAAALITLFAAYVVVFGGIQ